MPKPIEDFLAQLQERLRGKVEEGTLIELQAETRLHLEQLTATYRKQDPDQAEQRALEEFGSVERLARRYIRENPEGSGRRVHRWAMAFAFMAFVYWPTGHLLLPSQFWAFGTVAFCIALVAFLVVSIVARQSMVLRLAGVALASLPVISIALCLVLVPVQVVGDGRGTSFERRWVVRETVEESPQREKEGLKAIARLTAGLRAFEKAESPTHVPAELRAGSEFVVPRPIWGAPSPGVEWGSEWDLYEAKRIWKTRGRTFLKQLSRQLDYDRATAANMRTAAAESPWSHFGWAISISAGFVEIILVLLLALNFLGWLIGTIAARLIPRRRRIA